MPSNDLARISDQIEQQGTDSFSKFFMYANLLNVISIREEGKNIFTVQPKTAPILSSPKGLNYGLFGSGFTGEVNQYKGFFEKPEPDVLLTFDRIIKAYFRKGQLADMAFIIEKMLGHLSAHPLKPTDRTNRDIYDSVNFEDKLEATTQFINSIDQLNKSLLKMVDDGVNSGISAVVAVTGFSVVLASVFSLAGLLIGGTMMAAGIYYAYSYSQQNVGASARIQAQVKSIMEGAVGMTARQGFYENVINPETHKNFMLKGLIKPLAYSAVTLGEQLAPDEQIAKNVDEVREQLDSAFRMIR